MYAVAIRELKAKLSEYVRKARDGDVVLVTDRGRVVAELRAPTVQVAPERELGSLYELVQSGALKRGVAQDASRYRISDLTAARGTAESLVDWLREDRTPTANDARDGSSSAHECGTSQAPPARPAARRPTDV